MNPKQQRLDGSEVGLTFKGTLTETVKLSGNTDAGEETTTDKRVLKGLQTNAPDIVTALVQLVEKHPPTLEGAEVTWKVWEA